MVSHSSPEHHPEASGLDEPHLVELFTTRTAVATESGSRASTKLAELLENPTRMLGRDLSADELEGIKNVLRGFADNPLRQNDFKECAELLGRHLRTVRSLDDVHIDEGDFDNETTDPGSLPPSADEEDGVRLDEHDLHALADKGVDEDGIENAY